MLKNSISYILWFKQAFCHSSCAYSISVQLSFMKTNNINYDNEFSALHYARSNAPQAENDIKTYNTMFDNVLGGEK